MKLKFITEQYDDVLVEQHLDEATGKKNTYLSGIFLQSAIKNKNGRIYPEEVMDREVGRYIKEYVNTNRACGELNHPQTVQIDPKNICHRIVEMTKDGTNWIGRSIITNTPNGEIVKGLIESGVQLGVSSRGLGTLKMNTQGINEVQEDFRLACGADVVFDPSGPDCFVNGIMEGVEFWYDNAGRLIEEKVEIKSTEQIAEEARQEIERLAEAKRLDEQNKLKVFEQYLAKLAVQ